MELEKLFSPGCMSFDLKAKSKIEVIDELIDLLHKSGKITNKEKFKKAVLKREEEFSTGIGMGIAVPHGKDSSVKEPCIAFGVSKNGVDFDSMDGKPAYIFFLIAVPEESSDEHLRILSFISRKLMHENVRNKLFNAKSFEDVIDAFTESE